MKRPGVRRLFSLRSRNRQRIETEVDEEIVAHIQFRVSQLMERGWTRDDAEREARGRFGEFDHALSDLKHSAIERERRMHWRIVVDAVGQDFKVSLRRLVRAPGFALAVSLTLALGIGANAAMFGIVDRLLLRAPDHVVEPDRIVTLGVRFAVNGEFYTQPTFSYNAYRAFRKGLTTASAVGMSSFSGKLPMGLGADAEMISGVQTNADYFAMTGVKPVLGRFIAADDDREPVGQQVIVLSHAFWQRRFAGARDVIGKLIPLGNQKFTVIGVAPRGFTGFELSPVDVWIPMVSAGQMRAMRGDEWLTTRQATWIRVYAKLMPNASLEQLGAQASPINDAEGEPRFKTRRASVVAIPLMKSLIESRGPVAMVAKLLGALSIIVVLIACTNVVNLMLSRAASRRQEVAVRLALGVTKFRLGVQLLTETLVLSLLGALGAGGVAWIAGTGARKLIFGDSNWAGAPVDVRIATYIGAVSVGAALIAGFIPLLQARKLTLTASLRSGAREGRRSSDFTRSAIIVSQAALSVLLLVSTGLFWRSLQKVNAVPLGMDAQHIVLGRMNLSTIGASTEQSDVLFREMARQLRGRPEIQFASVSNTIAGHSSWGSDLTVPGIDSIPFPDGGGPYMNGVESDFFSTVGTKILEGRAFTDADNATSMRVAVINQTMARRLWPGQTAINKCIQLGDRTAPCTTVVGVAQNSRRQNWIESENFQVEVPLAQSEIKSRVLLVRPRGDVDARVTSVVQQVMRGVGANMPFADVRPLVQLYEAELRPWRLGAGMLGGFAALALFLVSVGLFATISFFVSQRTHEIGVRMALGARANQVVRLVMRQGLVLAGAGAFIGVLFALLGGRFIQDMLFEVAPNDVRVFALTLAILGAIALCATLMPAYRAARISPTRALRAE